MQNNFLLSKFSNFNMKNKIYDLIIIGSGPAGLTAGIYAIRYKINTMIIGKLPGGLMSEAYKICNFPSYYEISGLDFTKKVLEHTKNLKIKIKQEEVIEIKKDKFFVIKTNNRKYKTKKIIIAIGTKRNKLNIPGETKFLGKGVSYCATCDARLFLNKTVAVVGGSDAALTSALLLSEYAKKVYIIYRKNKFSKAEPAWIEQVKKNKKIKIAFNSNILKIYGDKMVKGIKLNNKKDLKLEGVFIEIGSSPNKIFLNKLKLKTEKNYIKVNKKQETNISGVFAAGDITNNPLKQIITACSEGAIAAKSIFEELQIETKI